MGAEVLSLDWETKSVADLKVVGLRNYARHASTGIWCGAYAFNDEEPLVWLPGTPCPERIVAHVAAKLPIRAWGAPFEIQIWQQIATPRHGWPVLDMDTVFCSMSESYAMGLPGGLEDAALALGLSVLKDIEGRNLMLRLARPRSRTALRPCGGRTRINTRVSAPTVNRIFGLNKPSGTAFCPFPRTNAKFN